MLYTLIIGMLGMLGMVKGIQITFVVAPLFSLLALYVGLLMGNVRREKNTD